MPRWNETEFIQHAQGIAAQHVVSKKSLNELSQKFAADHALNPDEIRTLVRLANVATFQELFKRKDDGDKMVEFDTGDPEAVIRNLVREGAGPKETANIMNDKLAADVSPELPDLMREVRFGRKFDEPAEEKVAAETAEPPARTDVVIMSLRKLEAEYTNEKIAAGQHWESTLDTLTASFKRAPGYGPDFKNFVKTAWAAYEDDLAPELAYLSDALRHDPYADLAPLAKLASARDHVLVESSPQLELLQQAVASRKRYEKMASALEWVAKNMPELGR